MISDIRPNGFNPKFSVAGCVIEHNGKILLLKYPITKKDNPGRWASPAGKVHPDETAKDAVIREVFEETGLHLNRQEIIFVEEAYDRYPHYDYIYYLFKYKLISKDKPSIKLNSNEHTAYKWLTPIEALKEELVHDHDYCIRRACELL